MNRFDSAPGNRLPVRADTANDVQKHYRDDGMRAFVSLPTGDKADAAPLYLNMHVQDIGENHEDGASSLANNLTSIQEFKFLKLLGEF